MRRVLHFGDTKEQWWRDRPGMRVEEDEALMEGLRAYALEHASNEREFRETLEGKWADIRKRAEVVLGDLESSAFTETLPAAPVVVDINDDFVNDAGDSICDELQDEGADEEQDEEPIA